MVLATHIWSRALGAPCSLCGNRQRTEYGGVELESKPWPSATNSSSDKRRSLHTLCSYLPAETRPTPDEFGERLEGMLERTRGGTMRLPCSASSGFRLYPPCPRAKSVQWRPRCHRTLVWQEIQCRVLSGFMSFSITSRLHKPLRRTLFSSATMLLLRRHHTPSYR